jgi:UDP-N-acetylmuramate--alanine ligase
MKKKNIHFVGIKGVGMTPLAIIAKEAGFTITGSDINEEFITDATLKKAGITPLIGFKAEHITQPDLVITTGAHNGFDNIESRRAKEKGIEVVTTGQAVGMFMDGKIFNKSYRGISIAGTHGKTTTTGMLATILKESHMDPSFVIGTGDVGSLGAPGHFGKGKYFVAEADEYATEPRYDKTPKFMWQHPQITIFTNIEFDHPDVYSSLEDIRQAFLRFANQLPDNGVLIACGDDRETQKLIKEYKKKVITFGFSPDNKYAITKVSISGENMFFWLSAYGKMLGEFMLKVVGEHNALNAVAAFIAAIEAGVSLEKAKSALVAFTGSKRRLEYIGELATAAKVYDDYAHHPTEIKKTLLALRKKYPKKKIICFFQPHTFSRTKKLFDDFLRAFESVDRVVLTDIYASLRESFDPTMSSKILSSAMDKYHKDVVYLPKLPDVIEYINKQKFRSDTVLVTMGAGDIYKINSQLKFIS